MCLVIMAYPFAGIVLSFLIAYILGSIPTSYIIGKVFFRQDIRTIGSGNVGATNALRAFGVRIGIIVLLLDMVKGTTAVLLTRIIMLNCANSDININLIINLSGIIAILGHTFTLFLNFKGGKGVATAAGVFLALSPVSLLIALGVFVLVTSISRYVSLGSIIAAISFLVMQFLGQVRQGWDNISLFVITVIIILLIIIRHKGNIGRLIQGTENKINFKKK